MKTSQKKRKLSQIPSAPKTLGPVSDLERHLPSDWWRHLFNSLYLKTDGDVVENAEATQLEIELILEATDMAPGDKILDLCCGQGRHALELARRGFPGVQGVDRSSYLIRLARRRARAEHFDCQFSEGDARKFRNRSGSFDYVLILGNSYGYFEQKRDDLAVLETVRTLLRDGGMLVLDIADGSWLRDNFQARSWEWIDAEHFVCRERALSADRERLISREIISHSEKGVIADQFYAERLYSSDQIQTILHDVGFRDTTCHAEFSCNSLRNQDLGMMAHRMLLTAKSPGRAQTIAPASGKQARNVTVLLGDPTLSDPVKVGGQFNPEDFDTIAKLEQALAELESFQFTYVNQHAELIKQLRRDPPELVFNLCDEGFGNDPTRELHVPALLEMLGVPYTGGGPACLAHCYDKSLVRALAENLEIPVPFETYRGPGDSSATSPSRFPVLIKPNCGDSSVGITKDAVVHDSRQLVEYVHWVRETLGDRSILVQEFLPGREYSIGIVGNPEIGFVYLPALTVDYSRLDDGLPRILGYESKWLPDSPYWDQVRYCEADLAEHDLRRLHDYSRALFERLGCRDYARFDFREDGEGTIKLLEVNPNPGWCWDGKLNLMAGFAGFSYPRLLEMILEAAIARTSVPLSDRTRSALIG